MISKDFKFDESIYQGCEIRRFDHQIAKFENMITKVVTFEDMITKGSLQEPHLHFLDLYKRNNHYLNSIIASLE